MFTINLEFSVCFTVSFNYIPTNSSRRQFFFTRDLSVLYSRCHGSSLLCLVPPRLVSPSSKKGSHFVYKSHFNKGKEVTR